MQDHLHSTGHHLHYEMLCRIRSVQIQSRNMHALDDAQYTMYGSHPATRATVDDTDQKSICALKHLDHELGTDRTHHLSEMCGSYSTGTS